jgi:hypothetical protein
MGRGWPGLPSYWAISIAMDNTLIDRPLMFFLFHLIPVTDAALNRHLAVACKMQPRHVSHFVAHFLILAPGADTLHM